MRAKHARNKLQIFRTRTYVVVLNMPAWTAFAGPGSSPGVNFFSLRHKGGNAVLDAKKLPLTDTI